MTFTGPLLRKFSPNTQTTLINASRSVTMNTYRDIMGANVETEFHN